MKNVEEKPKRNYTKKPKLTKSQIIQKDIEVLQFQINDTELKLASMNSKLEALKSNKRDAEKEELLAMLDSKGLDIAEIQSRILSQSL